MLIGFTGKAGAGKSSLSKYLLGLDPLYRVDKYTDDLIQSKLGCILSFASTLKNLALDLGWNGIKDEPGRKFLQELGSVVRSYNPNYFVDKWHSTYLNFKDQVNVFVDDVRYDNEIKVIQELGGVIIYCANRAYNPNDTHESEQVPSYYDYILDSSKQLNDYLKDGKLLFNLLNNNLVNNKCPYCSTTMFRDVDSNQLTLYYEINIYCRECNFNTFIKIGHDKAPLKSGISNAILFKMNDKQKEILNTFTVIGDQDYGNMLLSWQ